MHSPMSRKRGRSKARAELTREQQIEQALALLQPEHEEREACASAVSIVLDDVRYWKEAEHFKIDMDRVAKALRAAEAALAAVEREPEIPLSVSPGPRLWKGSYFLPWKLDEPTLRERIKKDREYIEKQEKELRSSPEWKAWKARRRSRWKSRAKSVAVFRAWKLLLIRFAPHDPGLTEGGTWHQLAAVLFGCATVDMFSFDYLRDARRKVREGTMERPTAAGVRLR